MDDPVGGGAGNPVDPAAFPELAAVLRRETDAIVETWDEMTRRAIASIASLDLVQSTDTMPELLGVLADLLDDPTQQNLQSLVSRAPAHGVMRFRQNLEVPQLMAEGRLLRRVIVEQIERALGRQMTREESIGLHAGIDLLLQGGVLAMVQEQKEAHRRSEESYRLSIEQVRDYAIFMIDPQGRMASWNAGVRHVLGWEEEEFIGRPLAVLFPPEDFPVGSQGELRKAEEKGCAEDERWQVRRDGTRFWASGITTAIRNQGGQVTGFLKVMRDTTERKLTQEQLAVAKREAEAASHAKDEFLAVLSHELRTPLTPVMLAISLLETRHDLPPDLREDIETIRRSVELEARLIDDLLDLTRITRGKLQLNFEAVDAHLVARHAVEMCCRGQPHQIQLELHARQHQVYADPARLQQVLWNLINNALKFTPSHGRILVRSVNVEDRIRIEVIDTGIGIAPELLPRLFNAFEQGGVSTTRRFGGLGLGLAISRRLMEMHSGTLVALSEGRGRGATLALEMPIAPLLAPRPADALPAASHGTRRSLRILLVEDNEATLRTLERLLATMGHQVTTAGNAESALRAAATHEIDLVISDLGLPDQSGHDLMRIIRSRGQTPGIALSGYGMEKDIRTSGESGFETHLTKPVDRHKLEEAIRRVIPD